MNNMRHTAMQPTKPDTLAQAPICPLSLGVSRAGHMLQEDWQGGGRLYASRDDLEEGSRAGGGEAHSRMKPSRKRGKRREIRRGNKGMCKHIPCIHGNLQRGAAK